jgi:IstB-like ATP binding protein
VAAVVDRLVHHAEVIVLKGESYRLRGKREEVLMTRLRKPMTLSQAWGERFGRAMRANRPPFGP